MIFIAHIVPSIGFVTLFFSSFLFQIALGLEFLPHIIRCMRYEVWRKRMISSNGIHIGEQHFSFFFVFFSRLNGICNIYSLISLHVLCQGRKKRNKDDSLERLVLYLAQRYCFSSDFEIRWNNIATKTIKL